MNTIIYTPPDAVENEIGIISDLLDAGADYLYVRKPLLDDFSLVDYMEEFDPKYYSKIITASLIITKEFDLGGYHFTRDIVEKNKQYNELILGWLEDKNKISSVSAHSMEGLKKYAGKFDHVIVSPVFSSISKEDHSYNWDYQDLGFGIWDLRFGKSEGFSEANYDLSRDSIFFAVGGVDENKISEIKAMHFDGIGLLGALWKEPENALNKFTEILNTLVV